MTVTKPMFLEIGCRRFRIASFEEASRMFCAARDKVGKGASCTPTPKHR
jgi:hypothetical protein